MINYAEIEIRILLELETRLKAKLTHKRQTRGELHAALLQDMGWRNAPSKALVGMILDGMAKENGSLVRFNKWGWYIVK